MNQFVSTCSSIKQIATLKNNTWHTYSSIDFEMYVLYDAFSISFSNFLVFHLWALCLIQLHACSLKLCSWISGFRKVQQICTPIHNLLTFFLFSNQKIYRVTKIVYTTKDASNRASLHSRVQNQHLGPSLSSFPYWSQRNYIGFSLSESIHLWETIQDQCFIRMSMSWITRGNRYITT